MGQEDYPLWDLRVDDAPAPAAELRRLFVLFRKEVLPAMHKLPTTADPMGEMARELLQS